jgi:soluble lytic murein transglycosylase-like protein
MPRAPDRESHQSREPVWRRRVVALVAIAAAILAAALVVDRSRQAGKPSGAYGAREPSATLADPLAYDDGDKAELEQAASFAFSHALYRKSPGGVAAAAERTAAYRPLIDEATKDSGVDPDLLEAIVFLESGGRPNVIAGNDPARASGLTQILAETGTSFLGMRIDLAESRRLTAQILKASDAGDTVKVERLQADRRAIDERFEPRAALAGTIRYLQTAEERVGDPDLAVVSYHMGIGNLSRVIRLYANADPDMTIPEIVHDQELSWTQLFFDSTPTQNIGAYKLLQTLGDDSPSYYWRVLAAREIMRLYRDDPDRLSELDALHGAKASAEEVLHPPASTLRFSDAAALRAAWDGDLLQPLPNDPGQRWFAVDSTMGELAPRLGQPTSLYRGLRPEALAVLLYLADRVHDLSGATKPLAVTSSVRDQRYQDLLKVGNPEATRGYSLHTTGYSFDIRRRYESPAQARAFQYVLENLNDRGLITWVREPAAIHVTVSSAAEALVPLMLEHR